MKPETAQKILSLVIAVLLTVHISADIIYGYEPARVRTLIGPLIVALWLYAALALAGRRSGYLVLFVGGLLAAIVPVVHMSGNGVREEVVKSGGGFFFILTLIALAICGALSVPLSIHGLWRLRSATGFILWAAIAVAVGALFYFVVGAPD